MSKAQWSILEVNELLAKWRYDKPLDFEGSPMRLLIESLVSQIATNQSKLSSLEEQAQALVRCLAETRFLWSQVPGKGTRQAVMAIDLIKQALEAYEAWKIGREK